jgi:hypothetical protein
LRIRAGSFFGTTGEVLFHSWDVEGSGAKTTYNATIEYTFPLDFAELVWSDGTKVSRKLIDLTDTCAFGKKPSIFPSMQEVRNGFGSRYGTLPAMVLGLSLFN